MKKLLVVAVLFIFIAAGSFYYWKQSRGYVPESVPGEVESTILHKQELRAESEEQSGSPTHSPSSIVNLQSSNLTSTPNPELRIQNPIRNRELVINNSLNLKMPFFSQAPFGDWSLPWQEACEEASSLLVANVYQKKNWSREQFNQEILKIVEWEKEKFGAYEHTDVAQTVTMLKEYLGLESIVHTNPSFDDVKQIISKGHFMIAPLAGREIGNPFFTNGGPVYHMLVIKGYKENKVITHDVGTRNGENYVYSWQVINSALHDYAEPIQNGARKLIEVLPPNS